MHLSACLYSGTAGRVILLYMCFSGTHLSTHAIKYEDVWCHCSNKQYFFLMEDDNPNSIHIYSNSTMAEIGCFDVNDLGLSKHHDGIITQVQCGEEDFLHICIVNGKRMERKWKIVTY